MATKLQLRRVYADPSGESSGGDGFRVYVDHYWPQGESHQTFHYDLWAKDVAPSPELIKRFHADRADLWPEFAKAYTEELDSNPAAQQLARELSKHPLVTILFSSKDTQHNNAVVLADWLRKRL